MPVFYLTVPPGDVILRLFCLRCREYRIGIVVLDQLTQVHKGSLVGYTRGLLHIVRDDHDCVVVLQLIDELLDLEGRNRIQCRCRFI